MSADGTINIDVLLGKSKFMSDYETIAKLLTNLGSDAGDKMDSAFQSATSDLVNKTKQTEEKVQSTLGRPVTTKIKGDSNDIDEKMSRVQKNKNELKTPIIATLRADFSNFTSNMGSAKRDMNSLKDNALSLKDVITGTFVGGVAVQGLQAIGNFFTSMGSDAITASDAVFKFKSTMKLGGFGDEEINKSSKEVQKYANETVYELNDVSNTTAQLAANGIKNYMGLTEAAGNLNAQAGGNANTFKSVAMMLTQTAGAGKLTTENWNQLADAIPGASGVLQKAMLKNGAYTGNFRDAMANGQISADEFNKAVTQLGMNDGAVKAAKSTKTFEGAFGNLKANVVNDLDEMINKIGKKKMTDAINNASDAIVGMLDKVIKFIGYVMNHKDQVKQLGIAIGIAFGTKKIIDFISYLGKAKKAMLELETVQKLMNTFGGGGTKSSVTGAVVDATATSRMERYGRELGAAQGTGVLTGMKSKLTGGAFATIGSIVGKAFSIATIGAVAGMDLMNTVKANTPAKKWKAYGADAGTVIGGGIGAAIGGLPGAAIGATLGSEIGKGLAPKVKNALKDAIGDGSSLATTNGDTTSKASNKSRDSQSMSTLKKRLAQDKKDYQNLIDQQKSSYTAVMTKGRQNQMDSFKKAIKDDEAAIKKLKSGSSSSKTKKDDEKESTSKAVKNLGSGTVNKASIANVKSMTAAIKKYGSALAGLKKEIKKNDPTKQLNGMNSRLNSSVKSWGKMATPIKKIGNAFKTLASFSKSMSKKDAFAQLNKDFPKLEGTLKKSKIGTYLNKISDDITKSKLQNKISSMTKEISSDTKKWTAFAKPVNTVGKAFNSLYKFLTKFGGKTDPFAKLNTDFDNLSKTLKKDDIGKLLGTQVTSANKAVKNVSFSKTFSKAVTDVTDSMKDFKSSYKRNWKDVWDDVDDDVRKAMNKAEKQYKNDLDTMYSQETKFTSKFTKTWTSWLDNLVSTFSNSFGKLPGYASSNMNSVVSKINKGIGGLNTVIKGFGGKELSMAKYASGTSGAKGGLAVVGEQGYELAYDKKNGIYPVGTNGQEVRYLDEGTSIMPHHMIAQFMNFASGLPHHASGKGDSFSDMSTYLMEHYDEIAKDPTKFMTTTFNSKTSFSGTEFVSKFGSALSTGFLKSIAAPFKKMVQDANMDNPGGSGVERWRPIISAVAKMMGFDISSGQINKLLKQIQTESGGNPTVKQGINDINSRLGHPAQGLLQFIPSTFAHWAMPGHTKILNGADQIMAAINALNHGGEGGWGNIGLGHGWANGGHVTNPQISPIAEDGEEWVVNPAKPSADRLIMEAIQARVAKNPNGILGKALSTLNGVQAQAHSFAGRAIANRSGASVGRGDLLATGGNYGSLTINSVLDSRVLATATYPATKAMQAKEINVNSKKGNGQYH